MPAAGHSPSTLSSTKNGTEILSAGRQDPGSAANSNVSGIAFMIAGIFVVSVLDAVIKWLADDYHTFQLILFRCGFALVFVLAVVARTGGPRSLLTRRPVGHLLRAITGVTAMVLFFYSLSLLPLAEVIALTFAAPLFVTALSVPLLGEPVGVRRWSAVIVGFIGVLVIVRPGTGVFAAAAILPVLASLSFAFSMVLVRRLTDTETSGAIVFYVTIAGLLFGSLTAPSVWIEPAAAHWPWLVIIGLLGGLGQFLMTQGFRFGQVAVVAPFEYTALIWAVLFGWLIWSELPDAWTLVGAGIVSGAGLYIVHRETTLGRRQAAPETPPGV